MKKKNNKLKRYERKWVFNNVDYNQLFVYFYIDQILNLLINLMTGM